MFLGVARGYYACRQSWAPCTPSFVFYTEHVTVVIQKESGFCFLFFFEVSVNRQDCATDTPSFVFYTEHVTVVIQKESVFGFLFFFGGVSMYF